MDTTITSCNTWADISNRGDIYSTGIDIHWDSVEKGYGGLTIIVDENDEVQIDTESMGKEFFLDLMSKLYDMAEVK